MEQNKKNQNEEDKIENEICEICNNQQAVAWFHGKHICATCWRIIKHSIERNSKL